jgi:hypothetical protein
MIIKQGVTVYKCEYCKKKLFVKSSMQKHEKYCNQNPENFKACLGCIKLEEVKITCYRYSAEAGAVVPFKSNGFYCKALDKGVYPTKVEKLGLDKKHPETFENQIPMPKECEHKDDGLGWLSDL